MANADLFNPNAKLTGDNFVYFRAWIARENGIGQGVFSSFDGQTANWNTLTDGEKVQLTNLMNAYYGQHPNIATDVQLKLSGNAPISAPEPMSTTDRILASDTAGSVIATADKLNTAFNPFEWIGGLQNVKYVVIAGALIYFVGIPLFKAYVAGKVSAK